MSAAAELAGAIAQVQARIAAACAQVGRNPETVRLLPVTKTVSADRLREARQAGLRSFGENRVQEASVKARLLGDLDVDWIMIGHLQTNKAREVARLAQEFHALDSHRVAAALQHWLERFDRTLDVFIQVNTSGEASKFGLRPSEVAKFVSALSAYPRLRPQGLMTIAMHTSDQALIRQCFARLRELRDRLRKDGAAGHSIEALSMGMTADFEIAIEEGATIVRIGQAIFGPRQTPDSHYWPETLPRFG